MKPTGETLLRLSAYLPLAAFLFFRARIDTAIALNWQLPFYVAGALALASIAVLAMKKAVPDYIFLGINIYLVVGAAAVLFRQSWLTDINAEMQASGMLIWVCIVGLIATRAAPGGFIGCVDLPAESARAVRRFSHYLVLAAAAAFVMSHQFQGNLWLSETIPFAGMLAARVVLRRQLREAVVQRD